jgi:hypothetical protein
MLQIHIGGCRVRILSIDFISRTIRCVTTPTDNHTLDQWLEDWTAWMAQPCERGAAPHPPSRTERRLPATCERVCDKPRRIDHRTPISSTKPLPNHFNFFCQYLGTAQPCLPHLNPPTYPSILGYRPITGEDFQQLGRAAMTLRLRDPSKRERHVDNCTGLHLKVLKYWTVGKQKASGGWDGGWVRMRTSV